MKLKLKNKQDSMKYYLQTFGCQMNKSDSERIAFVLEKMAPVVEANASLRGISFKRTQNLYHADLVIINMCSVRQSAVDRVYGLISKFESRPSTEVGTRIVLTGCILPQDKKKLRDRVDLIFNIKDLPRVLTSFKSLDSDNLRVKPLSLPKNYLESPPLYSSFPSAYVPIMTGCNNFCAYCVVPYLRGKEVSRSPASILKEIRQLLTKGYKRIILLGQNVNSYQREIKNKKLKIKNTNKKLKNITNKKMVNFAHLLKMINALPGDFWLSFMTSHPKDLSDELIKTVFSSDKICKYFHLPVQSGSDKILKKMNRGYTVKHYEKIIQKIRTCSLRSQNLDSSFRSEIKKMAKQKKSPVAISTDIIVGFPGETIKDFNKTASLLKKIKFDMAYIAKYSPRPLTTASKLKDNVNSFEKKRRQKRLFEILERTALNNNKKYLNKEANVLIMGIDRKKYLFGETNTFKKVKIIGKPRTRNFVSVRGKFVKIKIIKATPWGLTGLFI